MTGSPSPVGATLRPGGVNFSLYSRNATGVELLLFDSADDAMPARVIRIDPGSNLTYHYWHVFVPGIQAGQLYGYRVWGPFDPGNGLRFDPMLGGPVGMAVGAAAGFVLGGATDVARSRVERHFAAEVERALEPGHSAVVAEIDEESTNAVDERMEALGGHVMRQAFSDVADTRYAQELAKLRARIGKWKVRES